MARKSTVAALPKELVDACNGLIRDGRTIDDILAALQGLGADVSRSAVGRYVKSARESMEKYRQAQEVAKVWVDKLEAEPAGDVGRLLPEMLRVVAFQTLTTMGESEQTVAGAREQLSALLAQDLDEDELAEKVQSLGCEYDPTGDGGSYRDWLTGLAQSLS